MAFIFRLLDNAPLPPLVAHPGFQTAPSLALAHPNGWGVGNHFALEVDPANKTQMVVEPGADTQIAYIAADSGSGGWTAAAIEAAESITGVDAAWVLAQTTTAYGLRSDQPLAWAALDGVTEEIGRNVYTTLMTETNNNARQGWCGFQRGDTFADFSFLFVNGHSPLHPVHVFAFGSGARPILPQEVDRSGKTAVPTSMAIQGLDFAGTHKWKSVMSDILTADCNFSSLSYGLQLTVTQKERISFYACSFLDNADEDASGATWSQNQDRASGLYAAGVTGFLNWNNFFDLNGWEEDYDIDALAAGGQPSSALNHNMYFGGNNSDVTAFGYISSRPSFSHAQHRAGVYMNLSVFMEGNSGGITGDGIAYFSGLTSPSGNFADTDADMTGVLNGQAVGYGASAFAGGWGSGAFALRPTSWGAGTDLYDDNSTVTHGISGNSATWIDFDTHYAGSFGNFSAVSHLLVVGDADKEVTGGFEGVHGKAMAGFIGPSSVKSLTVANGIDPNNAAAETDPADPRFDKSGHANVTDTGVADSDFAQCYALADKIVFGWGVAANDENAEGISAANRNLCTMGKWAEADGMVAGSAHGTFTEAITYLRGLTNRALQAENILEHFYGAMGKQSLVHAPGATMVFAPDPDFDGYRTDNPHNWLNGNLRQMPVDGDDCDLGGNLAYAYQTYRFADMDFGAGGGWRLFGGYVSCTSTKAISAGSVETRGAGQFWLNGSSSTDITILALGGRVGVAAAVSGLSGEVSGKAELLVTSGGALTINSGDTITLQGGDVRCGFDGQSGSASLTVAGTLRFEAVGGAMPGVAEYRSGTFGVADLGGGVQGQPREPAVASSVTLDAGSAIEVDVTGLASGSYTLIAADTLTDGGATLPSGVSVDGNRLILIV